jgi:hypothetical protein
MLSLEQPSPGNESVPQDLSKAFFYEGLKSLARGRFPSERPHGRNGRVFSVLDNQRKVSSQKRYEVV